MTECMCAWKTQVNCKKCYRVKSIEFKIEANRKKMTQALRENDAEAYFMYESRIKELSNSKEATGK